MSDTPLTRTFQRSPTNSLNGFARTNYARLSDCPSTASLLSHHQSTSVLRVYLKGAWGLTGCYCCSAVIVSLDPPSPHTPVFPAIPSTECQGKTNEVRFHSMRSGLQLHFLGIVSTSRGPPIKCTSRALVPANTSLSHLLATLFGVFASFNLVRRMPSVNEVSTGSARKPNRVGYRIHLDPHEL